LEWFIVPAPFGILMSIALYFVMTRMMPAEVTDIPSGRAQIRESLAELGPMKMSEKKLLAISLTLLLFWAAEGVLHSFDTSSTTIAAVALMFLPGIGIMTCKEAQPRIPWGTVVLFGIGISVGMALLQTKGASWLANLAVVEFGLKNATALFVLAVLTLFFTLIHLGFGSATALASAMIPIVIAVLQGVATPGINIVGMTMLLQFVVSFGFILVVNAPQPAEERAMTSSIKSYPLVDKVIEIFGDWLKQRQEIRELRELDAGEFRASPTNFALHPATSTHFSARARMPHRSCPNC
jgi:sodium-dependent dicarboxylate transporter 2/3/5